MIAPLCDKHRERTWLDNERLMKDHKTYLNRIIGITDRKLVEDSSEDSEGYAPGEDSDDGEYTVSWFITIFELLIIKYWIFIAPQDLNEQIKLNYHQLLF